MTTPTSASIERPVKLNSMIGLYQKLGSLPGGKWLFSKALCFKAPYFQSIDPKVLRLESGYSEWKLIKRRSVTNHIGTVHALAMGCLAEMCAGTYMEASLPSHLRWIPKSMTVEYLAKATTSLRGVCDLDAASLQVGDNVVPVDVFDEAGQRVFHADITMYVSEHVKQK